MEFNSRAKLKHEKILQIELFGLWRCGSDKISETLIVSRVLHLSHMSLERYSLWYACEKKITRNNSVGPSVLWINAIYNSAPRVWAIQMTRDKKMKVNSTNSFLRWIVFYTKSFQFKYAVYRRSHKWCVFFLVQCNAKFQSFHRSFYFCISILSSCVILKISLTITK